MEKMYKALLFTREIIEVQVVKKTDTMVEYVQDGIVRKERKKTLRHCFTGTPEEAKQAIAQKLLERIREAESALNYYQKNLDDFLFKNP